MASFVMSVSAVKGFLENLPLQAAYSNVNNAFPLGRRGNAEQRLLLGREK